MQMSYRTPGLLALFTIASLAAPAGTSPLSAGQEPAAASPAIELAARKGTRLYRPEDGGTPATTTAPSAPSTAAEKLEAPVNTHTLERCMETWDKGTHITKSRWREICKRQLNDRNQAEAETGR